MFGFKTLAGVDRLAVVSSYTLPSLFSFDRTVSPCVALPVGQNSLFLTHTMIGKDRDLLESRNAFFIRSTASFRTLLLLGCFTRNVSTSPSKELQIQSIVEGVNSLCPSSIGKGVKDKL